MFLHKVSSSFLAFPFRIFTTSAGVTSDPVVLSCTSFMVSSISLPACVVLGCLHSPPLQISWFVCPVIKLFTTLNPMFPNTLCLFIHYFFSGVVFSLCYNTAITSFMTYFIYFCVHQVPSSVRLLHLLTLIVWPLSSAASVSASVHYLYTCPDVSPLFCWHSSTFTSSIFQTSPS